MAGSPDLTSNAFAPGLPAAKPPADHFPCLNGFRTIAIAAVLIYHSVDNFNLHTLFSGKGLVFFIRFTWLGNLGVDLFFVLSGFLISGLLFQDIQEFGKVRLGRFYTRRAFKILPQYISAVIIGILVSGLILGSKGIPLHRVLPFAFFLQNYLPSLKSLEHLWSVAVEEHFYLLLPLLITGLAVVFRDRQKRSRLMAGAFLVLIGLVNILRFQAFQGLPLTANNLAGLFHPTHLRFDALIMGCLLRLLYNDTSLKIQIQRPLVRQMLFLGGLVITLWFLFNTFLFTCWWHYTLIDIAFCLFLMSALGGFAPLKALTEARLVERLGRCSYGLYIWHYIILSLFQRTSNQALVIPYVLCCLLAGILSTVTLEKYFLDVRKKLFP
jgi:peptidoglycan/LPS O-acetylase OafA/YrhL